MSKRFIYCWTNTNNGKVYIGQTKDLARRKANHVYGMRQENDHPLYRSMRKHGLSSFSFDIVEECTDANVDEREKHWITEYDSRHPDKGYNLAKGGHSHSDETHRKLSETLKGNRHCVGRKLSDETKQKIREKLLHRKLSDETKAKLSELRRQRPNPKHTDESRKKLSQAAKRRKRNSMQDKRHSEETKKRIAESVKRSWEMRRIH